MAVVAGRKCAPSRPKHFLMVRLMVLKGLAASEQLEHRVHLMWFPNTIF
jgi:hypothetical protein